ncbi:MAG TPA: substrate-binding domain-containing protein [Microbacterium sp.]|uniref:LacI family DNA-binding transcriptional regulator n=1 Tax=Microbacterium sp. TaxID=51671 RepID=UPI002B491AB1|nr:substrate-binding domain-containing protein [Microbacterium sp.]HKT57476.1 substrate-binding domain-containing protein [Microbacterium sp.]
MDSSSARRRSGRVGVREVAAAAGVSTQTVSRVINEHPGIRDETRLRVQAAMESLGYRVNNAARALGTSRSRTLGVIASDATLYGPSVGIAALESAARAEGRWMATAYADASDEASVDAALEHLLAQGVDGVILIAAHERTLEALAERRPGVPVTALHSGVGAERQAAGVVLAVEHLVALGHRRIARIGGPADWLEEGARAAGFDRALAVHAIAPGPQWVGDWSAASGWALAPALAAAVRRPDGPTAVAVANDQMALGVMAGLAADGLDVPADVSVVGFDDTPDAAFYRPALTTVRIDLAGEARRCVAQVLGQDAPVPARMPELIVRASTAPPAR